MKLDSVLKPLNSYFLIFLYIFIGEDPAQLEVLIVEAVK